MKLKYDLSSTILASFRGYHRLSFLFFYVKINRKLTCTKNKEAFCRRWRESTMQWELVDECWIWQANKFLARATAKHAMQPFIWVVMHSFSISIMAEVKIGGWRWIGEDWSWLLWTGFDQGGLTWIRVDWGESGRGDRHSCSRIHH